MIVDLKPPTLLILAIESIWLNKNSLLFSKDVPSSNSNVVPKDISADICLTPDYVHSEKEAGKYQMSSYLKVEYLDYCCNKLFLKKWVCPSWTSTLPL